MFVHIQQGELPVSKKIIDPQVAVRHRVEDAMKYAQAIEDGYEFPLSIEIEGVGTLLPGRLFQLSKPDADGNHVRELGWYRFDSAIRHPQHKWGEDKGYWGTIGEYTIMAVGPFNKNGTKKGHCRQRDLCVGIAVEPLQLWDSTLHRVPAGKHVEFSCWLPAYAHPVGPAPLPPQVG